MKRNSVIIISVVILIAIGYGMFNGRSSEWMAEEAYKSKAVPVEIRDVENIIYTSGKIRAKNTEIVLAKTNGVVSEICVQAGESVSKGQTIANLASENLLEQIAQKKLSLQIDKNNYIHAKQNAELKLKEAKNSYEEKKEQYKLQVISKSELEMALQTYEDAENGIVINTQDSIATELETKYLQYQQSELMLTGLYNDLEATTIKSPMDGIITSIYVNDSDTVNTNNKLFEIAVLNELQVHTTVGEYDINRVKLGMPVVITGDAFENEYKGKVINIAASASNFGNESAVEVLIDIENEENELKHNFSANANILVSSIKNVLTVPVDAVGINLNGETVVQVRVWDEYNKRYLIETTPVTIGIQNDLYIEIKSEEVQNGVMVCAIYRPELDPKGRIR